MLCSMYLFILPHYSLSHPSLPGYNEIPMYFFPQNVKENFDIFFQSWIICLTHSIHVFESRFFSKAIVVYFGSAITSGRNKALCQFS